MVNLRILEDDYQGLEPFEVEVKEFCETYNLLESIKKTIFIFEKKFRSNSNYNLFLGMDLDDNISDEESLIFEIEFRGIRSEFKKIFNEFLLEWLEEIDEKQQDYIDFGFKIN